MKRSTRLKTLRRLSALISLFKRFRWFFLERRFRREGRHAATIRWIKRAYLQEA
jgi:hypothetical protein